MTVKELIEKLQQMPQDADVYVVEFEEDAQSSERDPMLIIEDTSGWVSTATGKNPYPHGRVKL